MDVGGGRGTRSAKAQRWLRARMWIVALALGTTLGLSFATTPSAFGRGGPSIHFELEGRVDGAYARGTIAMGTSRAHRLRVVLQQQVRDHGRIRWRVRAHRTV